MKQIKMGLLASTVMIFTACGGGGTSSDTTLSSNSVLAEPTIENGIKVKDAVATNQTMAAPGLNSVNDNSKMNTAVLSARLSQKMTEYVKNSNIKTYSLNEVINEAKNCYYGGTITMNGSGDSINGGNITFTAANCNDDGYEIINGSMYMSISNLDNTTEEFKDLSLKFTTDFTVTNISDNTIAKISQNSYMNINITKFDIYGSMEKFKLLSSIEATNGVESYGLGDCIFYFTVTQTGMEMHQTQGRVFINNLTSYVDYDKSYDMSITPFTFGLYGETLTSGEARYNMSGSGKVKIRVESNVAIAYVDADGDGTYELSELPL